MSPQIKPGKRSRKVKVKKNKWRRMMPMLLLLMVLLLIYSLTESQHEGYREEAHHFLSLLKRGDVEAAISRSDFSDSSAQICGLNWLLENDLIEYSRLGNSKRSGWDKRKQEVIFEKNGQELVVLLEMEQQGNKWTINSFSHYQTVLGGLVIQKDHPILEVFYQGEKQEFDFSGPSQELQKQQSINTGDVLVLMQIDGEIIFSEAAEPVSVSRILKRTGNEIEGEKEGVFPLHPHMSIYREEEGKNNNNYFKPGEYSDLMVGRNGSRLYLWEEKVVAAVVEGEYHPENIRVILNNSTKENLSHQEAFFQSNGALELQEKKTGRKYTFSKSKKFTVRATGNGVEVDPIGHTPIQFEERVFFNGKGEGIIFSNLQRPGWDDGPRYPGTLEVVSQGGELFIVNELPLEKYLRTVVLSEMPSNFGEEALKVQAIAARSYAYRSMLGGGYGQYGAHVDDSISSQVYHYYPDVDKVNRAVEETRGIVPFYQGEPVDARFFSTSSGYTANHEEVWSDRENEFPGQPVPYLQAASQVPGQNLSLNEETRVKEFLEDAPEEAYDYQSPFFRWRVEMSREELQAAIEHNIRERYRHQPSFVLTREQGEWVSKEIPANPLGELTDVKVVSRGEGGNIKALDLEGSNGIYRIIKEYNIRFTLRPVQYLEGGEPVELELHREENRKNYQVLPSTFAYIDTIKDGEGQLDKVVIVGGGNGHGVGMSQYGAKGMAEQGYTYEEILKHYYPGIELKSIY